MTEMQNDIAAGDQKPLISVVVPCHNASGTIRATLESVLQNRRPHFDLEVIVIDDGSSDDSPRIASSVGTPVAVLRQCQKGVSAARNAGISIAKGQYVAFCDADDIWAPGKLEDQLPLLQRPEVVLVASDGDTFNDSGIILEKFSSENRFCRGNIFRDLLWNNFIPTSSVLVKREALIKAGMFDESLSKAEDLDLWLRIAQLGVIDYSPKVLLHYRVSTSQATRDYVGMKESRISVLRRHVGSLSSGAEQREIIANAVFNFAQVHAAHGRRGPAFAQYAEAIRLVPYNLRYWLRFAIAMMPRPFVERVKAFRRRVSG